MIDRDFEEKTPVNGDATPHPAWPTLDEGAVREMQVVAAVAYKDSLDRVLREVQSLAQAIDRMRREVRTLRMLCVGLAIGVVVAFTFSFTRLERAEATHHQGAGQ